MKFLDFWTPEYINKLCKEFKVRVQIEAVDRRDDEIVHRVVVEHPPGSGNKLIEEVKEKWERIELQSTREIRSWSDLFQSDGGKYDIYPYLKGTLLN